MIAAVDILVISVLIHFHSCSFTFPYCPAPNFDIVLFLNLKSVPWVVLGIGFNCYHCITGYTML